MSGRWLAAYDGDGRLCHVLLLLPPRLTTVWLSRGHRRSFLSTNNPKYRQYVLALSLRLCSSRPDSGHNTMHHQSEMLSTSISSNDDLESKAARQPDITLVDAQGDLVLRIEHDTSQTTLAHSFRVSKSSLKQSSKYFAGLLDGRFGESEEIEQKQSALRKRYGTFADVPASELPVIHIKDIGRISTIKSIEPLCADFLAILHGKETAPAPPVANLANLAIVGDRFDALNTMREYFRRKKTVRALDGKTTPKVEQALTEEKVRQRLLVAVLLDYPPWMREYSTRIIVRGWIGRESTESAALWWDLPSRLEEELVVRREYILDAVQSTLGNFVKLYTSRARQCRLGYDSSAACDAFQLGEMMRFLSRIGAVRLQGTLLDTAEPPEPYTGDLHALIDSLRQVPEYQVDKNHTHCGIRTRLIPILDVISEALNNIGICAECWSQNRFDHAWMDAKRPLLWRRQTYKTRGLGHVESHMHVRSLFMATEREWS